MLHTFQESPSAVGWHPHPGGLAGPLKLPDAAEIRPLRNAAMAELRLPQPTCPNQKPTPGK
jgi:hypothetical protein